MNLFSEIYNCYYQVIKSIIINNGTTSSRELTSLVSTLGYEESVIFLIPKLMSGEWNLFKKDGDVILSNISSDYYVPLTTLQRSYIKTFLLDDKIKLFFNEAQITSLSATLSDCTALYSPDNFYYYDRFEDKDDYTDPEYIHNFRALTSAIKNHQYVDIDYQSENNNHVHHYYLPYRLEYSIKNDKFRVLAVEKRSNKPTRRPMIVTLNLSKISKLSLCERCDTALPDIASFIKSSYYKEPVKIIIKNRRNALERIMLQFANYEKNTTHIDSDTYECLIYYNKNVETELLIELLSFGPMIQVVGHEGFLKLFKERLTRQARILSNSYQS